MISWVGASSIFLYSFVFYFVNEIDFDYRALEEDISHYCYNLCNTIAIILDQRVFSLFSILYQWHCIHTLTGSAHLTRDFKFHSEKKRESTCVSSWKRDLPLVFKGDAIKIDLSQKFYSLDDAHANSTTLELNGKNDEWNRTNNEMVFIHKDKPLLLLVNEGINHER